MRKLLAFSLALVLVLGLALSAAAAGVYLEKTKDAWVLVVSNGYEGTVSYRDNKQTYTKAVNGDGSYDLGLQRNFTGELALVGNYGDEPEIIGTRTVVTTERIATTNNASFLAQQPENKGPKANFVQATATETFKVTTKVFDVWSDGNETLRSENSTENTETYSATSGALPNGSEKNYPVSFAGGLGGFGLKVSYNGNGNKVTYNWTVPAHETTVSDSGVVFN